MPAGTEVRTAPAGTSLNTLPHRPPAPPNRGQRHRPKPLCRARPLRTKSSHRGHACIPCRGIVAGVSHDFHHSRTGKEPGENRAGGLPSPTGLIDKHSPLGPQPPPCQHPSSVPPTPRRVSARGASGNQNHLPRGWQLGGCHRWLTRLPFHNSLAGRTSNAPPRVSGSASAGVGECGGSRVDGWACGWVVESLPRGVVAGGFFATVNRAVPKI